MVILGKQAIDDDSNQTGQMLAACSAGRRAPSPRRSRSTASRSTSPARSTAGSRRSAEAAGDRHHRPSPQRAALREPAQHHEGQVEAAREKTPADYGVDTAPRLKVVKVVEPSKRQAGVKVASVDELIGKLKTLGVVA
jgi:electron transfer flavoprotein beta subunit